MPQNQNDEALSVRQRELFIRKSMRVASSYLRKLESFPDTPEEIRPFFDVLRDIYVERKDVKRPEGVKTVGTYCILIPAELVYAAGAMPVRLCSGSYTAYSIGDEYVPRDACPLVKAVMGFCQMQTEPVYDNCSLMVIPVTCDCKKKVAGMLEQIKPTVVMHLPPEKAEDADTEEYLRELYRLIPHLERVTGKQITADSLAEAINDVGYAQYEMSQFMQYRRSDPALLYGNENFRYNEYTDMNEKQFNEFIDGCMARRAYDTGYTAEYGDTLLTLSTCEYSHTNGRFVVVAKLINE